MQGMARSRRSKGICAYCGGNGANTLDHVIPRGIWGTYPPPKLQLPTVPACDTCNQAYAADEEYFRFFASTGMAFEHPVVRNDTWSGPIRRMLRNRTSLRAELVGSARPATLRLPSGLVMPTVSSQFDPIRIGRVLEKMARGLYYFGLKRSLPGKARIRTFHGVPDGLEPFLEQCPEVNMGEGIVRVRWGYDDNEPCFMLCWFRFYDDDKSFTVLAQSPDSDS